VSKYVVTCTWDEVPHLTDAVKKELWESIPPHQREARSRGIPSLGSGAIYPVPESSFVVPFFEIPEHWERGYGLDVGWNRTACIWGARDPATRIIYLYSEHYRSQDEPSVHATAIKSRGEWIQGVIDPAARGRSQRDGQQLLQNYLDLGLLIQPANNAVQAGIDQVWELLTGGMLKVFATLGSWLMEFRLYRRDEAGKIVKEHDHLMDATKYFILSGRDRMTTKPAAPTEDDDGYYGHAGWMG
jgi:hypothetical protein